MKTILRNFIVTLKRFKTATFLNILGLGIAFAAFILIIIQVNYERGFDKFHTKTKRIFRVEYTDDSTSYNPILSRPMIDLMMQNPLIEEGACVADFGGMWSMYGPYLTIERGNEKAGFKEYTAQVFPDFARIFDFKMIEGDRNALESPGRVLIPESMAKRFWGNEPALNRRITFINDTTSVMTVGGVYRDFPANTLVNNRIYTPLDKNKRLPTDNWGNMSYSFFVALYSPEAKTQVENECFANLKPVLDTETWCRLKGIRLTPLPDVYYQSDTQLDFAPKGNKTTTFILLGIALLIIVVAAINFVNFSTSLTPLRLRSINTQKVLGSSLSSLRGALMMEAVGISVLAFILALAIVYLLGQTAFTDFMSATPDLSENRAVTGLSFAIIVGIGLLAGIYPAFYSTSVPPALVLKGSFGLSLKGRRLRTALIGFQFVVSIGLIIGALFMQVQNEFLQTKNIGLNTGRLALAELDRRMVTQNQSALVNRLKESPLIEDVSFGMDVLGGRDRYSFWVFGDGKTGEKIRMEVIHADWNLPKLLGVKVAEGRYFQESDNQGETRKLLVNEAARKKYGLQVGDKFSNGTEVIGIMENFNFASLRKSIEPMTFMVGAGAPMNQLYAKMSGDPYEAADHIKNIVATFDPTYPLEVKFYHTVFTQLYEKERKITGLITLFSLLAVVISLVGVFGLVLFETHYRQKEIGLRKVMGATILEILTMFNKKFIRIVSVCFVVAAPLAWYGVTQWLSSFAYRTPIHSWIFVLSLCIVMLITLLTVTIQSWRAAIANPVDSLRSE